ncbi:hypothetical protein KOR34_21240 [Posidoniimonas corsicana]|uniref:Exonuclease domain-containing protein n=1 Tax=Posidoniimonas corsicana TaxID=1938618 RepID=A0A5C5VGU2_9BACT|nr:3'-5' exonuclease [Posidoniimonas corsicana]TWT37177.1 hypothetical protein KOR34_21240 [Posidoniimonas corsicana]
MEPDHHSTVFLDIERAGRKRTSPIIELAAIAVVSGSYQEIDRLETRVQFSAKDSEVRFLGLSKFRPSVWEQYAIPEEDAIKKLAHFLRKHATEEFTSKNGKAYRLAKIAGHNVEFDAGTLRAWFRRHGEFFPAKRSVLDTRQLSEWFFSMNHQTIDPPADHRLETLAEIFSLKARPTHTALSDALAAVELARTIAHYTRVGIRASEAA